MFKRWITLDQSNQLVIGPRRSGKTTFLKNAFPNIKYITLDDLDYLKWARSDGKGFIESLLPTSIIDEVQRVPELTIAIKYAIDNLGFTGIMTGSSSIGLLDSSADTLAGRIKIHHFPTACWGEDVGPPTHNFFEDTLSPPEIAKGKRALESYLQFGGFPEVLSQKTNEAKEDILKLYRDTYFTRDLAQLSNIENIEGLLAILNHAARSIGSHLDVSSFAQESGLSHPTAKKYLNVLTQSDLAFKLYGYQYGPAKRYLKASKLYFADNGILSALKTPISMGQSVENFVISELEKRRKLGFIKSDQFYYYKSTGGAEVDLIFEQGKDLYAVEIKSVKSPSPRDVSNLINFSQNTTSHKVRPFLVHFGEAYRNIGEVRCIPIYALFGAK